MNIAMLLSGGVDSSVALALLQEQGHTITAFYLKIWLEDELSYLGDCPWEEDLAYARAVCENYNISLEVVPFQQEYKERVIAYTIKEVQAGRTPNPDMMCNPFIKFGAFCEFIGDRFDAVATGHYAGTIEEKGIVYLTQTPDPIKDQTYFLARLSQEQLRKALFPLNCYTKQEVRELAQKFDLPTKLRKDSQGLCFLGKITFKDFIKHHVGTLSGDMIVHETGQRMGTHEGFWFYTIGQRQGLGLAGGPWYVVKKDPLNNIVYISNQYHAPDKQRDTFMITDCMWSNGVPKDDLQVKVRHGQQMYPCTILPIAQDTYKVVIAERDQGIAAGQFAVLYQDKKVVGSGIITI